MTGYYHKGKANDPLNKIFAEKIHMIVYNNARMNSNRKILVVVSFAVLAWLVIFALLRSVVSTRRVRTLEDIASSRRPSPVSQPTDSIQQKSAAPEAGKYDALDVVDDGTMTVETEKDRPQVRIIGIDNREIPAPARDVRTGEAPDQPRSAKTTVTGIGAAPRADAGPDQTVEQQSHAGAEVTLDGSGSTDPDSTPGTNDNIISFDWHEGSTRLGSRQIMQYTFPLGSHAVALVVADILGQVDYDTVTIKVVDTTPPEVTITSPEETTYLNTQGPISVSGLAEDRCDASPEVKILLDGQALTEDSIDLGGYLGETEHTVKVLATDRSSQVGEDSVTFKVIPMPMRSFLIERAEIALVVDQQFGQRNIFLVSGSFELPEDYQRADLERSAVLGVQIGGTEGKDEIALTDLGRAWSYTGSFGDSRGQGIDIERMYINFSFPENSFSVIGELSSSSEGAGTVTLEIPVAPYAEAGSVAGKETFAFEQVNSFSYHGPGPESETHIRSQTTF